MGRVGGIHGRNAYKCLATKLARKETVQKTQRIQTEGQCFITQILPLISS
jgi:hypothetical protein